MLFVKNSNFLSGVFFKPRNERSFSDIPNRKEWFLQLKRRLLKKDQKIKIFQRG